MHRTLVIGLMCAVVALLSLAGCVGKGNLRPIDELRKTDETDEAYTVKNGDVLMVKVWGEPRLSGEVYVRDDGKFTLPLIEDVEAAGKKLNEVSEVVQTRLDEFVPAPSVSISVVQSAPVRYYLSGAFVKPGEYRSDGKITFLQAIATGSGFAPFASEGNVTLIRQTDAGEVRYELDYNRVIDGTEPNPELKDGDVIAVK